MDEVDPGGCGVDEGGTCGCVGDATDDVDEVEVEDCVVAAKGEVVVGSWYCWGYAVWVASVAYAAGRLCEGCSCYDEQREDCFGENHLEFRQRWE